MVEDGRLGKPSKRVPNVESMERKWGSKVLERNSEVKEKEMREMLAFIDTFTLLNLTSYFWAMPDVF